MKKALLIIALVAMATVAFGDWATDVVEGSRTEAADTQAVLGNAATIYAEFKIAPAKMRIGYETSTSGVDVWTVDNFMPGDIGWQTGGFTAGEPFQIENTGGVTLDISVWQVAEASAVQLEGTAVASTADWTVATDRYRMWAVITAEGGVAPAAGVDMSATNYLATSEAWYTIGGYLEPTANIYSKVTGTSLNLWASDDAATAGTVEDKVELYLGFSGTIYGWTTLTEQLVTIGVGCKLADS